MTLPAEVQDLPVLDSVKYAWDQLGRPYPNSKQQRVIVKDSVWPFAVERALENGVSQTWAEFGVENGTSARYFLSKLSKEGKLLLFDSFEGLPEAWGKHKKGHRKALMVPKFWDSRVEIRKGWFKDTLPAEELLGLVHVDCDLYSSTKEVLEGINVVKGSVLIFDEFFGYEGWENHEYKALMEWDTPFKFLVRDGSYRVVIEIL